MNRSTEFRSAYAWQRPANAAFALGCSAAVALTATDVLGAPTTFAGQAKVWIVGPSGQTPDVQAAIDAAAPGDIILVDAGAYAGFTIDAKSLTIATRGDLAAGESVAIGGEVLIKNLALGDSVVLQGDAFTIQGSVGHALEVRDSLGSVRVQGLVLEGACGYAGASGMSGLVVDHASDVGLAATTVVGGPVCGYPGDAGTAIQITASNVALYDVTATGSNGVEDLGTYGAPGTHGGSACTVWSGFLFASHSTFQGGDGANGADGFGDCSGGGIEPGSGGNGGHGILLADASALARVMGTLRDGGIGGLVGAGALCTAGDGASGLPESLVAGATFVDDPVPARSVHAPNLSHEHSGILFQIEGEVGDRVYLFLSTTPGFVDEPLFSGVTLSQPPYFFRLLLGTIPSTGVLEAGVGISELGAGVEGVVWHVQTFAQTAGKKRVIGGPATLVVLDSQF